MNLSTLNTLCQTNSTAHWKKTLNYFSAANKNKFALWSPEYSLCYIFYSTVYYILWCPAPRK